MLQLHLSGCHQVIDWPALSHDTAHDLSLQDWIRNLQASGQCELDANRYGDLPRWRSAVDKLPRTTASDIDFNCDAPAVTLNCTEDDLRLVEQSLQALHPWRKGPFCIDGIRVDAEWRSDKKWQRIRTEIAPLSDRSVLDVGCGNGYFCFRLLGDSARLALGIDPSPLFNVQFTMLKALYGPCAAHMLPIPDTALADCPTAFDTVFSMGVLYHRKSPFEHLSLLFNAVKPGGELLLETLVVPGDEQTVLVPPERYARMRNVWFLPSVPAMEAWLRRAGFTQVRCVDETTTTTEEQRSTPWMTFESHDHAIDPEDPSRTVEGLPVPRRAAFVANRPR